MPSIPGNRRIPIPNSVNTLTADSYADKTVLGIERRHTLVEIFDLTSNGTVNSSVLAPTGSRILITGVSLAWPDLLQSDLEVGLEVTLAGSGILGTSDMSLGTYAPVIASVPIEVGTHSGILPAVHPAEFSIVTSAGDGATALWRANASKLTTPDAAQLVVYYAPIYAEDLGC